MSLPENRVTRTTVIYENLFKRIKQKDDHIACQQRVLDQIMTISHANKGYLQGHDHLTCQQRVLDKVMTVSHANKGY